MRRLKLPSPSMAVAVIALFVALTSTAAAVTVAYAQNADKVDGRHANQLIRLAATHITTDFDNWDGSTLTDSRTITAPKRGLLLITYNLDAAQDANEAGAGTAYVSATPKLDGTPIGASTPTAYASLDFSAACCETGTIALQRVVHVGAGSHTVSVDIVGPGGVGQLTYLYERDLSVLYVPFKGNGLVGRVLPLPRGDSSARMQP
jgi:hypothetical protein